MELNFTSYIFENEFENHEQIILRVNFFIKKSISVPTFCHQPEQYRFIHGDSCKSRLI